MNCTCHQTDIGRWIDNLSTVDSSVAEALSAEMERQQYQIELIASENIVSKAVLQAQGSVLTNKYAEGYSGRRYYGGCKFVDVVEDLAISRAKQIFKAEYVNVQPHSGAQANEAVFLAFLQPNDTIMGMSLSSGGHLTHGAKVSMSGKWFNSVAYDVNKDTLLLDYDEIEGLALSAKPRLIIAGGSAYPRIINFQKFREIADKVGALLMVDMAHFAGLTAAGLYPNPVDYADIVTTTTHKTLRGPRGGMILTNNPDYAKKINSAVFPGLQGGPLMHVIAGKAVAFGEVLKPEFKLYAENVVNNAKVMSDTLKEQGYDIVSGGTDTHLMLVDLRSKGITGLDAETSLERAHITCNKNGIPFDAASPRVTSGIRLGSPAATTRGFTAPDFKEVAVMIADVLDGVAEYGVDGNAAVEEVVTAKAIELCNKYPIYDYCKE